MIVRINVDDNRPEYTLIAEDIKSKEIITEVSEIPSCTHAIVDDIPDGFMQMVHPGRFGEYMNISTIDEITEIKVYIGDELFKQQNTINELRMQKKYVEQEMIIADLITMMLGGM